jgi:hypothetical protein
MLITLSHHVLAFYLPTNSLAIPLSIFETVVKQCQNTTSRHKVKGSSLAAMKGSLTLNQKTVASHLLWLLQAHSLENRRRNVTKDAVGLLKTPALGRVGHDKWNFVGCVRGLGFPVCEFHFFGVSEQTVSVHKPEKKGFWNGERKDE